MTKTTLTLLALTLLTCFGVAHADSVDLTWTAPGDDGQVGTATRYDLRFSSVPIDEYNWDAATPVMGLPAPGPSGTPESFTVDGLTSGQTYYFALRTADDVLNWSPLSNVLVKEIVPETIAPADIADLNGVTSDQTSIILAWSAPGDDGWNGDAAQYDLRYAEFAIDESNWSAATVAGGLSTPRSSGNSETFTVAGLNPGTQYYFAIKTADEVPNWSGLSNVAVYATAAEGVNLPPAEIADLTGTGATTSSVSLSWTAPGGDGNLGAASQYDVRYATSAITESNWNTATSLGGLSAPQPAGSLETYDISGLTPGTTYYFAIKTADEVPQWSGLSNVASVQTMTDANYPMEITDLVGIGHTMTSVSIAWTAPGAEDGSGSASQYDLRFANYEITDANWNTANRVNSIGTPRSAGTLEAFTVYALTPNIKYYFAIKAADQSGTWSAMSNVVTRTTGAESVAPADVVDLVGVEAFENAVTLSWTAPGDNGASGTASEYDLRYATSGITDGNWNVAVRLQGLVAPQAAGNTETYTISGLNSGTEYFFALKAADEVPNWSGISNIANIQTLVVNTPPGSILNLAGSDVSPTTITLTWSATGSDGNTGTATTYDLCCATAPITESNWSTVTHLAGLPSPSTAGSSETFVVTGLEPATQYYFAIKACDEIAQWSSLSNVVNASTEAENLPPADISSLAAMEITPRSVSLAWTATGADGSDGTASQYDLRYAQAPITEANWNEALAVADVFSPSVAGTQETHTISGLTPATQYYFAIKAADETAQWSGLSNIVGAETDIEIVAGNEPPADISDLSCTGTTLRSVSLTWTAPGADGTTRTASEYELRFANYPIDENNWSTANRVNSVNTPKPAGTTEEFTVWALTPGITYYFALKTADDLPSWSGMSNVVTAVTGEETTPLTVTFDASPLTGEAPLEVSFTSEVSGDPVSWQWDFGDGSTSTDENPAHVYNTAGSYTVALTVDNASASVTESRTDYIVVSEPASQDALHVSEVETSRKQYKIWCRGYADVYVVDSEGLPVEGAQVKLTVTGPTSESLSASTNAGGVAQFKTRVTRKCDGDWCFAVTDISHPTLPYDAMADVMNSTCYAVATFAAYGDFDWEGEALPENFTLEQNYPNPFNPTTEITFSLPAPSQVRLVVINMLGQEVATLIEGQQDAGWHSVTWDGRSTSGKAVASGLYFYHLQADDFSDSRKMMLLK